MPINSALSRVESAATDISPRGWRSRCRGACGARRRSLPYARMMGRAMQRSARSDGASHCHMKWAISAGGGTSLVTVISDVTFPKPRNRRRKTPWRTSSGRGIRAVYSMDSQAGPMARIEAREAAGRNGRTKPITWCSCGCQLQSREFCRSGDGAMANLTFSCFSQAPSGWKTAGSAPAHFGLPRSTWAR